MTVMDRAAIQECIPHRDPFLWLDEIVSLDATHIVARKFLAPELHVFQGHYPQLPIFPGVLQCEACFQAAAVLISRIAPVSPGKVPVVTKAENVRFRRIVRPGETLELDVSIQDRVGPAFYMVGKAGVGGQTSARLEFVVTETDTPV